MPSTNPKPWLVLPKWQQPKQATEKPKIPTDSRPIKKFGYLDPESNITPGVHVIWLFAPNENWAKLLRWVAHWNTSWKNLQKAFLVFTNSRNQNLEFSFPASHNHAGKWLPSKGFDEKKKALWFLVSVKAKAKS